MSIFGGTAIHIEGSRVGSDDVDDWNLLNILFCHEADQWPARTHIDEVYPADMIGGNYRSCDGFSVIELFFEVEADLEGHSSCVDPEEIHDGFRVLEVPLQRANKTVGGKIG